MKTKMKTKTRRVADPGHVAEEDGHFLVNQIKVIDGFNALGVKKMPVAPSQWVEVIHRNGDRDIGPAECFAWGLASVHANDRADYHLTRKPNGKHGRAFELLDIEIIHWREISEPSQAEADAYRALPVRFADRPHRENAL